MLRVFPDAEALGRGAAEEVGCRIARALETRGRASVALAGGSTPRRAYRLLAREPLASRLDPRRIEWFWGDERAVPASDPRSNARAAREELLEPLGVPEERIHAIHAEREDLDAAADDYQREIARVLGADPDGDPPSFDLALLGLGADGHTASLFPRTSVLRERRRWVVAQRESGLDVARVTLTAPILNAAAEVLFLVSGAEKARALSAVLEGEPDPQRWPAQLVRPRGAPARWLVDAAAAAELSRDALARGEPDARERGEGGA